MATNENSPPRTVDTLASMEQMAHTAEIGETRAYVEAFIDAAQQAGPDAAFEYERALAVIRKSPERVVVEIAGALGECEVYDYPRRWALIFAVGELHHKAALPLLITIVETPLPCEPQPPSHGFSIVGEETILRTTAIESIGYLAETGDEGALEALFRTLRQPSISMRRAAVQALLSTKNGNELRPRITAYLSPEEYFLLQLKTPKVTEVPQVEDAARFLSEEARQSSNLQPPAIPGFTTASQSGRAPKSDNKE